MRCDKRENVRSGYNWEQSEFIVHHTMMVKTVYKQRANTTQKSPYVRTCAFAHCSCVVLTIANNQLPNYHPCRVHYTTWCITFVQKPSPRHVQCAEKPVPSVHVNTENFPQILSEFNKVFFFFFHCQRTWELVNTDIRKTLKKNHAYFLSSALIICRVYKPSLTASLCPFAHRESFNSESKRLKSNSLN